MQALTTHVGGLPTRYLAAGEGPPVVLVHGVGESAFDWHGAMAHLSRARRVYAPDLPAVGGTGRPATGAAMGAAMSAATGDFSPAYHARLPRPPTTPASWGRSSMPSGSNAPRRW